MRRLCVLAAAVIVGALAPQPPAAAVDRQGRLLSTPLHLYRYAGVGNTIETSIAASPDGTVWTAANQNVVGVAALDPADWLYKTTNGGFTWTPVPHPGLPGLMNEGDVAVGPSGSVWVTWLDLSRHAARAYVSHDGGATFTESVLIGPQPVPDRPWVLANASAAPGAPEIGLSVANAIGPFQEWGSPDGGATWLTSPRLQVGVQIAEPVLRPDPFMDFSATTWGRAGSRWTPLPGGGFLDTESGTWTPDMRSFKFLPPTSLLRALADTRALKISSTGTVYQARLAGSDRQVEYRYLKPGSGAWSEWVVVANLSQPPSYCPGLSGSCGSVDLVINTFGSTLGINTRDGTQDILIRVQGADTPSPVITRENIGNGCTARYDYPTLVFDRNGRAVVSFCPSGTLAVPPGGPNYVAYEQS